MELGFPLQPFQAGSTLEIVGPRPPFTNRDPVAACTLPTARKHVGQQGLSAGAVGAAVAPSLRRVGGQPYSHLSAPNAMDSPPPPPPLTQSPGKSSPSLSTGRMGHEEMPSLLLFLHPAGVGD